MRTSTTTVLFSPSLLTFDDPGSISVRMSNDSCNTQAIHRRQFMTNATRDLGCLVGLGVLPGCTVPVRTVRVPAKSVVTIPIERYPELERPGGMVKVLVGRLGAVFVRRGSEGFEGISAVCTHQGCIVDPAGRGFRCPCHGSSYDHDGINVGGPAPAPLSRFRVTSTDGLLRLHLKVQSGA